MSLSNFQNLTSAKYYLTNKIKIINRGLIKAPYKAVLTFLNQR
ncbi:MAG: hypothetical protein ACI9XO_002826 [Paraglaciecola sp.]|jgi:hypothetical protein